MKFFTKNGVRFLTFDIFPKNVRHAIFTRHGGLSPDPWNSLNVGGTVGDVAERVRKNRFLSFQTLDINPQTYYDVWQIHSADVVVANSPHDDPRKNLLKADAIITDKLGLSLFMRFADCTPIFLYDPQKNAIGIVHSGWLGTVKKVAAQAVKMMEAVYGSAPEDVLAAIGPAIGPDHYEIGENVINQIKLAFGVNAEDLLIPVNGSTHLDLWSANRLILEEAGVRNIELSYQCTACHTEDWYSHRGDKGKTGRFGALISLV